MASIDDIFGRWEHRRPYEAAVDTDPATLTPCANCGQTFAWRGYEPLCGWCYEEPDKLSRDLALAESRIEQLERRLVAAGVVDPELGP